MKPAHLAISAFAFVVAACIALVVIRGLGVGDTPLAFVMGAIVGTQTGAILHARLPDSDASASAKLALGVVLAVTAVLFGFIVHATAGGIKFPEVTLPISAIGAIGFPFFIFNQMFNAMRKSKKPES